MARVDGRDGVAPVAEPGLVPGIRVTVGRARALRHMQDLSLCLGPVALDPVPVVRKGDGAYPQRIDIQECLNLSPTELWPGSVWLS